MALHPHDSPAAVEEVWVTPFITTTRGALSVQSRALPQWARPVCRNRCRRSAGGPCGSAPSSRQAVLKSPLLQTSQQQTSGMGLKGGTEVPVRPHGGLSGGGC